MKKGEIAILVGLEAFLGLTLWLYLQKFPILPEYQSADFIQYVRISSGPVSALFQRPLSETVLYYDAVYYIGVVRSLFPSVNAVMLTREAMAALVFVSPVVVYASVRTLVGSSAWSLVCTTVYTLGGYVWFGMAFNSGLYANFFGVLASLALAASTVWAASGSFSVRKVGVLGVVLVFALFSHYSTLLLFPALFLYLGIIALKEPKRRKSAVVAFGVLAAPLATGAVAFSNELSVLAGFLTANSGGAPSTDGFSQALLAVPVLGYIVAEVTFDIGAVLLLGLACVSIFLAYKTKNELLLIPLVWFFTIVLVAPMNASAWRFAFVALLPLTILASYPMALMLKHRIVRRGFKVKDFPNSKRLFVFPLVLLIVSGGWVLRPGVPLGALSDATTDTASIASMQNQTMQAISWMKTTWGTCGYQMIDYQLAHRLIQVPRFLPCTFLDVTDWHFIYSPDFGGPTVEYDPTYSSAPDIASFHALQNRETYLIVTNVTSFQIGPCQSTSLVTLTPENFTGGGVKLLVHLFSTQPTFSNAALYVNGHLEGTSPMANNSATANLTFDKQGTYVIKAQVGTVWSNSETFTIGIGPQLPPVSTPANTSSCQPFFWTSQDLSGATLAWNSTFIHIWKLTS